MKQRLPIDCSVFGKELFYGMEDLLIRTPLKTHQNHTHKTTGRLTLIYQIFVYFLELVIKDVIRNNVRFSPHKNSNIKIYMDEISGEEFLKSKRRGGFSGVDPIASNNTSYKLAIARVGNALEDIKPIKKSKRFYIGWQMTEDINDRVNRGLKYNS